MAAPTRKHDGDSCSNIAHNKARKVAPTEPEGKKAGDKLQKLFGDFKGLGRHQVRDMGDEEALECYCKIRSEDLDWETTVGSAISANTSQCANATEARSKNSQRLARRGPGGSHEVSYARVLPPQDNVPCR